MVRLALLLFCLPAMALAQPVSITHLQPTPGTVKSMTEAMYFSLTMAGSVEDTVIFNLDQRSEESSQRIETVRAWSPERREITVTYGVVQESEISLAPEPGQTLETSPVSGRSYSVVWTKKGGLKASPAGRGKVGAEEMAQIEGDFDDLGEDDSFSAFLAGRSFNPGERLDVPKHVFEDLFESDAGLVVGAFSLTLRELSTVLGADVAVFDVAMTMTGDPGGGDGPPLSLTMPLAGRFLVRTADAWPVLLDLSGPLTAKGSAELDGGITMQMLGTGRMGVKIEGRYGAP